MPKVLNKKTDEITKNSVYIGRGSEFGSPFFVGRDGGRKEVIEKYINWINNKPELIKKIKEELKGKDLVCYCSPLPCHGDYLLKIANEE